MKNDIEKLNFRKKAWNILGWTGVLLAVLAMIGLLVVIVLIAIGKGTPVLMGALAGGLTAGLAVLGALAFLGLRRSERFEERERDAIERADSEDSFFVGEGLLATFGRDALRIHGARNGERTIPYRDMRFFSVCSRRKPAEKGTWSVVMEIPAHYLTKKKGEGERPVLIETAAKERLYRCLEAHGLTLLGELPSAEPKGKKYTPFRKFTLPDAAKRRRAFLILLLGIVLTGAGVGLAFWNTTVGAVVLVVGAYLLARAAAAFVRAKAQFTLYEEGVFYREPSGADNVFLKWEEIGRITAAEDGKLRAETLYGAYEFPPFVGAYEAIGERFPEKCGKEGT